MAGSSGHLVCHRHSRHTLAGSYKKQRVAVIKVKDPKKVATLLPIEDPLVSEELLRKFWEIEDPYTAFTLDKT